MFPPIEEYLRIAYNQQGNVLSPYSLRTTIPTVWIYYIVKVYTFTASMIIPQDSYCFKYV